jgi:hypothetical protein
MGWQGRYLFLYDLTLLEESGHQVIILSYSVFLQGKQCSREARKAPPPPHEKRNI